MKTTTARIEDFEIVRTIRRGHYLTCKHGVGREAVFANRPFQVAA